MNDRLPYIDPATFNELREIDLLSYIQQTNPNDLYRRSTEYRLHSHPRFNISNGKWYDFDEGIGGYSALDYYTKVHRMSILEAAHMILNSGVPSIPLPPPPPRTPKAFALPEANATSDCVYAYLRGRGIHPSIIHYCIKSDVLYESRKHSNCVFVGRDPQGEARYAFLRGTWGDFRMDVEGSVKRYGFRMPAVRESEAVGIFESPIDALSHATLYPNTNIHRLSLGGTSSNALMQYLADYPDIRTIYACLDNDDAGRKGTEKIRAMLPSDYLYLETLPPEGKDYNEYLQLRLHSDRERSRSFERS